VGAGGGVTASVDQAEVEALRAEIAALRRVVADLALLHGEASLVLSEMIRRMDRHASLHMGLAPKSADQGLKASTLLELRSRVDASLDDVIALTDGLLERA
jgi:hypothetical protein